MGICSGSKLNIDCSDSKSNVLINQHNNYCDNKCIEQLEKLFNDPMMTKLKLINSLTSILTINFNLIIHGDVIFARYSGIEPTNLDVGNLPHNLKISCWELFESVCKKIFIINAECTLRFLKNEYIFKDYEITTMNRTSLNIRVGEWSEICNQLPYFDEDVLYIHMNEQEIKSRYNFLYIHMNKQENKYQYYNCGTLREGVFNCAKTLIKNLRCKMLNPRQLKYLTSWDTIHFTMHFRFVTLKRLTLFVKKGYKLHKSMPEYNKYSIQKLAKCIQIQMVRTNMRTNVRTNVPMQLIDIIVNYVNDGEYYERNAICCHCEKRFVDEECFLPFCDCISRKDDDKRCFIHCSHKVTSMIQKNNFWHYECYASVIRML